MLLNQGDDILINSIDAAMNIMNFKTISNVPIPAHCIATILTKLTGKCIIAAPCMLEVERDEVISIQNLQLVMMPTVHLKDGVETAIWMN